MKKISYKFHFITRENDYITKCGVFFYEGDVKKVVSYNSIDKKDSKLISKYIREKRLVKKDLDFLKKSIKEDLEVIKTPNNNDAVIFTNKDFGEIKTNDELRLFLNKQIAKDESRKPEAIQSILDIKKVK